VLAEKRSNLVQHELTSMHQANSVNEGSQKLTLFAQFMPAKIKSQFYFDIRCSQHSLECS
ncbi:Protein of unknown function, partial [Gryllus bimaculatus]